jgi:hypothetical protein
VQGNDDLGPGNDLIFSVYGTPGAKVDMSISGTRAVFFLPEASPSPVGIPDCRLRIARRGRPPRAATDAPAASRRSVDGPHLARADRRPMFGTAQTASRRRGIMP